jgi:hypothetical protein
MLESEVSKAVTEIQRAGIKISAIHKHVLEDEPRLAFVHIEQAGDAFVIGDQLKIGLQNAGLTYTEEKVDSTNPSNLDVAGIQASLAAAAPLGAAGLTTAQTNGSQPIKVESSEGVLEVSMPRAEQFTTCATATFNAVTAANAGGTTVGTTNGGTTGTTAVSPASPSITPGLGNNTGTAANALNTCVQNAAGAQLTLAGGSTTTGTPTGVAAGTTGSGQNLPAESVGATFEFRFQPIGNSGRAIVAVEMPLLPTEVADTMRILADAGTSMNGTGQIFFGELHNHNLTESPRLVFLHVTAVGNAVQVADIFRAAIANNQQVASGAIQARP